jgi:hypothetical protein
VVVGFVVVVVGNVDVIRGGAAAVIGAYVMPWT